MRKVNHEELIVMNDTLETLIKDDGGLSKPSFAHDQLSDIFGINIEASKTVPEQLLHKETKVEAVRNSALTLNSKRKKRADKIMKQKKPLKKEKIAN